MFWRFHEAPSASVDELLSKENVTLEQLLNEEDVLQECKAQNSKVVDFLTKPEMLESLVSLLVTEPAAGGDPLTQFRYSSLASEVLSCGIPALLEKLACERPLLHQLTAPLRSAAPPNPLLASFMSRALALLLVSRPEQLLQYLQSEETLVEQILHHLGTSAVMDLLCNLVTGIEQPDIQHSTLVWLSEQRLVQRLAALVGDWEQTERQANAAAVLVATVTCARQMALQLPPEETRPNPLLDTMETVEFASSLLDAALADSRSGLGLVQAVNVLLPLLETRPPRPPAPEDDPQPLELEPASVAAAAEAVAARLPRLHAALVAPPPRPDLVTSWGRLSPPLGSTRLQLARLTAALIAANKHSVNCELARLGTVEALLDLFFHFTLNNFLHSHVESCVAHVLEATPHKQEDGSSQHPLLTHMFGQSRLIQRILEGMELQDSSGEKGDQKRCRRSMRAYCGHLVSMSNKVVAAAEEGPAAELVRDQLAALPEDVRAAWDSFKDNRLISINELNRPVLPDPRHDSDAESDFRSVTDIQQAAILQLLSEGSAGALSESMARADDHFRQLSAGSVSLPADSEARPSAADLFEQRCSERLSAGGLAVEAALWPPRGANVAGDNSSSDEDDDDDERVRMEVDTSDPWAGSGAGSPGSAMDTNVWQSAPAADFGADRFWANFDALPASATARPPSPPLLPSATAGSGKGARSPPAASSPPPFPVNFSAATALIQDSPPKPAPILGASPPTAVASESASDPTNRVSDSPPTTTNAPECKPSSAEAVMASSQSSPTSTSVAATSVVSASTGSSPGPAVD